MISPYARPAVWRSRSWTVIGRVAAARLYVIRANSASAVATLTCGASNAGRNFDTGSVSCSLPSSTRSIAATETSGFVME